MGSRTVGVEIVDGQIEVVDTLFCSFVQGYRRGHGNLHVLFWDLEKLNNRVHLGVQG